MRSFLKYTLASMVGVVLAGIVMTFISFAFIGAMIGSLASKQDKQVNVKDDSVLHMKLTEQIVDRAPKDPFEELEIEGFNNVKRLELQKVLDALEKAKTDDKVKGIFLDISSLNTGLSSLREVRNALEDFKTSEKFVYAYSEEYSQGSYYLGSVANEVYMYPEGGLDFKGLNAELMFMKGMLDKLDIEAQVIRGPNNDFKSAVEPFFRESMSDSNRVQITALIDGMWNELLTGISTSRGIDIAKLNMVADSLMLRSPEDAVEMGFVDGLKYRDEVYADLRGKLGIEADDKINFLGFSKYMKAPKKREKDETKPWEINDKVAVIYAAGGISSGNGDDETIGSARISKAIRKARKDTTVKAIVLRVNSPGGSALASDVIWRETMLAKKEKPFVVSMGEVAASGGYYIACGADRIFASPTTITGSIGVFGVIPSTEGFFKNHLGITFDRASTNAHAKFLAGAGKLDSFEDEVLQGYITDIYNDFVAKVAEGRGMDPAKVDQYARGRVWMGTDALKRGLVDELGGLQDAIDYAAEAAGIEDYKVQDLPKLKDPFEDFFKTVSDDMETRIIENNLGSDYKYFQRLKEASAITGIQARLPYFIDIY